MLAPPGLGAPFAAATAPYAVRNAPSRRATAALLQRALAAVDTRLVAQLSQLPVADPKPKGDALSGEARLELACLLRADRMLRHGLQSLSDDVVLCDSQAELAEGIQAMLVDLEGDAPQRSLRLLAFLRELLSELSALQSKQAGSLKLRLQRLRSAVEAKPGSAGAARQLPTLMHNAARLFGEVNNELERLCPRPTLGFLEQMSRTLLSPG